MRRISLALLKCEKYFICLSSHGNDRKHAIIEGKHIKYSSRRGNHRKHLLMDQQYERIFIV